MDEKRSPHVSLTTKKALLAAYDRLKSGSHSGVTDGRLTIANVALEAGCGRATAYRCTDLTAKFPGTGSQTRSGEVSRIEAAKEGQARKLSTERELRRVIKQLLNRIVLLESRERHLLDTISKSRRSEQPNPSNVVFFEDGNG